MVPESTSAQHPLYNNCATARTYCNAMLETEPTHYAIIDRYKAFCSHTYPISAIIDNRIYEFVMSWLVFPKMFSAFI